MISEKTVELNITTELVNWLFHVTEVRPYILAPSQVVEGRLGFDVTIGYPGIGTPFLLQYKRAEFRAGTNEYVYHLNRNASRDQHLRLYVLEQLGWEVFYVLPLFHLPADVVRDRQHLLPRTLYLRPSWMVPSDGSLTGFHDVRYNLTSGKITIHSDEGQEVNKRYKYTEFVDRFRSAYADRPLYVFIQEFDSAFANQSPTVLANLNLDSVNQQDYNLYNGLSLIVKQDSLDGGNQP